MVCFRNDVPCVLCEVGSRYSYVTELNVSQQVPWLSRLVTSVAHVRSHVSPSAVFCAQSGTSTGFPPYTSVCPVRYHSTNVPYLSEY